MKILLRRFGILLVILGVIMLAISEFSKIESNNLLIISGGLIVMGLIAYIVINNIVE